MWIVNDMKRWAECLLFVLLVPLLAACDAEELVTLGTLEVDETTGDAIHCHFEVSGDMPMDCGFYYATTKVGVESWTASKVRGRYGLREVQGVIEGLNPNTTYFVRGYVMTVRGRVCTETLPVKTTLRTPQADDNKYPDIDY